MQISASIGLTEYLRKVAQDLNERDNTPPRSDVATQDDADASRDALDFVDEGEPSDVQHDDAEADAAPAARDVQHDEADEGKTLNGKGKPTSNATAFDDVTFTVATAKNRDAKYTWKNEKYTWKEFKQRLQHPTISENKDVGGYVGGKTIDGQREATSIPYREIFTADLDFAGRDFVEHPEKFVTFEAAIHSSHSYTDEAPRVRIVALQSRKCTAAEFCAISQVVADALGVTRYDGCSFTANQFMFWPSKSSDAAPWYYHEVHGQPLNVDELLKVATDRGYYDEASKTAARVVNPKVARGDGKQPATKQTKRKTASPRRAGTGVTLQDPRDKRGVIGATCRAYTLREGIETFLGDFYKFERTEAGGKISRYTWLHGHGATEGLRVFEDKQVAYAYNESDPTNDGREYNLFDLMRVHLYKGDQKATEAALARDDRIYAQLERDQEAEVKADFDVEVEVIKDAVNVEQSEKTAEKWKKRLTLDKNGRPAPTRLNVKRILLFDPRFRGFALNTLANAVEVTERETVGDKRGKIERPLPWKRDRANRFWTDADRAHLMTSLESFYAPFKAIDVDIAFTDVTDTRRFNPLQDWLNGLPKWDGVKRVEYLLIKYMGADDNPYTRAAISKTLLAAVTRAFIPGCKFDYVLILDGPQGIGKSTFWRVLAGEDYYTDNLTIDDMNDKTAIEKILGYWIVEIAELAGMNRVDAEKLRTFITRKVDVFRPAYGHNVVHIPRQCILAGTVNGEHGYLNDTEGQRRMWPVVCHGVAGSTVSTNGNTESGRCNWTITASEREQIWAEVYDTYKRLIAPHLDDQDALDAAIRDALQMNTPELRRLEFAAQTGAIVKDERESRVERFLDYPIPVEAEWNLMTIVERQNFILYGKQTSRVDISAARRVRDRVCGYEIWVEGLGNDMRSYDKKAQKTITQMMKRLSFKWINTHKYQDFGPYGNRALEYRRDRTIAPLDVWTEPENDFKEETE